MLCLKKNHKKLVPIIMMLIMAALMVSCLSMSVFAGNGEGEIQDDSPYCMKKSEQVQLGTDLGESAKLEKFVSENTEVAIVNNDGVVEAVGPGETTITAQAKLVESNEIQTVTYNIVVKGLVAEFIEITGTKCTVRGTAYGEYGKKVVDGDLIESDIGDIVAFESGALNIKNNVTTQNVSTLIVDSGSTLNVNGTLNVTQASTLTFNSGSTLNVNGEITLNHAATLTVGGTLTINGNGKLSIDSGSNFNVGSGGKLNVNITLNVNSGSTFTLNSGSTLTINGAGKLNVDSGSRFTLNSGSTLNSDGKITLNSGGKITLNSGGEITLNSGGEITLNSGGTLTVNGDGILKFKNAQGTYDTVKTGTYTNKEWRGL